MSAAHTPGPWEFVQAGSGNFPTWNVRIGDRGFIRLPATADMDVMDADARLIAAAPDLLAALQALVEEYEPNLKAFALNAPRKAKWESAIAAIAKADYSNGTEPDVLPHWECHGPCRQGRAECPTPEACERPPGDPDGLELLGGLAVVLLVIFVLGMLVAA